MKPESSQILIEKYLLGQLTPDEQKTFDGMQQDPSFQKTLSEQQDFMQAIKSSGRDALKAEMRSWEQDRGQIRPFQNRRRRMLMWGGLAAALVALLFLIIEPSGSPDPEMLFASNFQPYDNVVMVVLRNTDPSTSPKARAFYHYEFEEYDKALPLFESLLAAESDPTLEFYRANSLMKLGQIESAISSLELVRKSPEAQFYPHAAWYLALAKLKQGQQDGAKGLLQEIEKTEGHPFFKQATELLKDLE